MSDQVPIPTSAACPSVEAASAALAAILVGRPPLDTALTVSEAILVLGDVLPPLPPLTYPATGTDAAEGIQTALAALDHAVDEASTAEEALRAGRAGKLLRNLMQRRGTAVDLRVLP